MVQGRFARACLAVVLAMPIAGCGSDGPPEAPDPFGHLGAACTRFAEVGCAKNAECRPPAVSTCMSTLYASCVDEGQQHAPTCVFTAAFAIDDCNNRLEAMTCADYCTTTSSGTVCSAPCVWVCP